MHSKHYIGDDDDDDDPWVLESVCGEMHLPLDILLYFYSLIPKVTYPKAKRVISVRVPL